MRTDALFAVARAARMRGPANTTAALSRQAGEIRNSNVDFIRRKAAQEIRDERDFCPPSGLLADTQRGVDEAGKRRGFDRESQRVLPSCRRNEMDVLAGTGNSPVVGRRVV